MKQTFDELSNHYRRHDSLFFDASRLGFLIPEKLIDVDNDAREVVLKEIAAFVEVWQPELIALRLASPASLLQVPHAQSSESPAEASEVL